MITKIQSFTDVITNSSSTVFVMHESNAKYYDQLEDTNGCISIEPITFNWLLIMSMKLKWFVTCLIRIFQKSQIGMTPSMVVGGILRIKKLGKLFSNLIEKKLKLYSKIFIGLILKTILQMLMKSPNKPVTMRNGVIIGIKIQSINDIITNSSSEVVCTIKGEDLKAIYDLLKNLLPNTDSEMGPTVSLWEEGEWDEGYPALIQVDLPYGFDCAEFFREGVKAILDQTFGKDFYTIEYDY